MPNNQNTNNNRVFRDGNKLVRPTGESPRQFSGMVFAVYEGTSPETVREFVRTSGQLRGLVEVDVATLSVKWRKALHLPPVEAVSKPADNGTSDPVMRGQRRLSKENIPAPRCIILNPAMSKNAVPYFMIMALIGMAGFNEPNMLFVALCIFGALYAVLYQCAITIVKQGEYNVPE